MAEMIEEEKYPKSDSYGISDLKNSKMTGSLSCDLGIDLREETTDIYIVIKCHDRETCTEKGGKTDDFFFLESDGDAAQKLVCDLVSSRLPKAYGFDPVKDIQVLCPTKVGPTGSVELNRRLQEILNPPMRGKPQIGTEKNAKILRLGDKVMQIKNDYDITYERDGAEAGVGAYNGDLGIITAVDPDARAVTVMMDDRKYVYSADQLAELEPAYAVTVHKSQGSEFPAVILPVADVPARLCYRNLLYTGVTRARKLCVLTGTARTEEAMVRNVRQNMRYSGLRFLLADAAAPTAEKYKAGDDQA